MRDGGLDRLRALPFPIWVVTSSLPRRLPVPLALSLGLAAYNLEKRLRAGMVHPTVGRRLGFRPVIVDARACESAEELTDLVLASSATPPFTPIGRFRGEALIDGGVIDNVPAFVAETVPEVAKNLVILSRPYPPSALGRHGRRLYLAPSQRTPVECWDYTRSDLADATHAMGGREAPIHEPSLGRFLGDR